MDEDLREACGRRHVLGAAAGIGLTPLFAGGIRYRSDRKFPDEDRDGIPDETKRSHRFHRRLSALYGDQFEGLRVGRRDLLLDVRYVGDVTVSHQVKRGIERRFRDHDVYLQWLDHPARHEFDAFEEQYGNNARDILWGRHSFYRSEIEEDLRNVALQLVMVPGALDGPYRGRIYSPWADAAGSHADGFINGMNFGNRAVAAERHDPWEQTRLVFHEIAHLALCHDDDPTNRGVMGTNETLTLTPDEWDTLRSNLRNVRDTTGFDLLLRPCLWIERADGCAACGLSR